MGEGISYGALTVVNAIPSGFGGAFGIDLRTRALIQDASETRVVISVRGKDVEMDRGLVDAFLKFIEKKYGFDTPLSIAIETDIPPSRGLKSSSSVSNALVMAFHDHISSTPSAMDVLEEAVEISKMAGVTVTGALDDASASLLGGLCMTDNYSMKILKRMEMPEMTVHILVDDSVTNTSDVNSENIKRYSEISRRIFSMMLQGYWEDALVMNGLLMAPLMNASVEDILRALATGQVSGLSGTGPAVFTLGEEIPWDGDVVTAKTRNGVMF